MTLQRCPEMRGQDQVTARGSFTPALLGTGTGGPPAVSVSEGVFQNLALRIELTLGGILGVAIFRYSVNGGAFQSGVNAGALVNLSVGLLSPIAVSFSAGTYFADNVYTGVI